LGREAPRRQLYSGEASAASERSGVARQGWRRNIGRDEKRKRRERRRVVGEGEIKYSIIEMEWEI
jgi:hypothetical protein